MGWEDFVKKGKEYIEKEEYDKAIEYLNKSLEICPEEKKWDILSGLAICYRLKKEYDKSIEYYNKALKIYPEKEKWYVLLGLADCYCLNEEYNKAIEYYNKALDICPEKEKWDILSGLAICYLSKKEYDIAIGYFNKALETCPNKEKWIILSGLAVCYRLKEEYDKAIEYLNKSLEICPEKERWRIYRNLAIRYYSKEEYDKVMEYFDEILEYLKKYPEVKEDIINKFNNDHIFLTYRCLKKELNNEEEMKNNFKIIAKIIKKIDDFKEKLKYKPTNNKTIAHYTKPETIVSILKAKSEKDDNKPYFRLYNACYMNDPEEGKIFLKIIAKNKLENLKKVYEFKGEDINLIEENPDFQTFIGSFIVGNKKENIDKLFFWRTYGKDSENEEAKGICICINKEFFDQDSDNLPIYLDNIKPKVFEEFKEEFKNINNDEDKEKFCLYRVIYENTKYFCCIPKLFRIDK